MFFFLLFLFLAISDNSGQLLALQADSSSPMDVCADLSRGDARMVAFLREAGLSETEAAVFVAEEFTFSSLINDIQRDGAFLALVAS
jgi:hypothetical protein